jgi:uncharacterized membrane protein YuzA (DUF378 family)
MKSVHMLAVTLLLIGGLNWGLVALGYNVVDMLLGSMPMLETAVYALVGLAALYEVFTHKANCKMCGSR